MTQEDAIFAGVEWKEIPASPQHKDDDGLPIATHEGVLDIGRIRLRCYQLSDGRRLIDSTDVAAFLGISTDGE